MALPIEDDALTGDCHAAAPINTMRRLPIPQAQALHASSKGERPAQAA